MLCGDLPFSDKNPDILYPRIRTANEILPDLLPPFLSLDCQGFLLNILETNPSRRLRLKQIKKHPWLFPKVKEVNK